MNMHTHNNEHEHNIKVIHVSSSNDGVEQNIAQSLERINRECCCFNMRKIMRAVTQFYDAHFEKSGIRSTQFTLLAALALTSAKTLTEIADSLVMDRTTLTRNLKPLSKMGLITVINTADKRSKAYALTDKGKEILHICIPAWEVAQEYVVKGIGSDNYRDVISKLENLLHTLHIYK